MLRCILIPITFQFQCGAIGSLHGISSAEVCNRFQFQCGAIGSVHCSESMNGLSTVSIPVWCDWKYTAVHSLT